MVRCTSSACARNYRHENETAATLLEQQAAPSEGMHAPLKHGVYLHAMLQPAVARRSRKRSSSANDASQRVASPCCLTAAPYNSPGPRLTRLVPTARRLQTRNRDMCAKTKRRAYAHIGRRCELIIIHCTTCIHHKLNCSR